MSNVSVDANQSASNEQPQSSNRRKFLTVATSVIGGVGAVGAAIPFVASWNPSAKAKAAGADIEVDISGVAPGQLIRVMWRSKPVWIVRRTPELLASLEGIEDQLRDPSSEQEQQPLYAQNRYRSIKEEYLVLVGICTHLGCVPAGQKQTDAHGDYNGWFCPCHGSHYDTSGRIRKGPAPKNLPVPPYEFVSDTVIKIG